MDSFSDFTNAFLFNLVIPDEQASESVPALRHPPIQMTDSAMPIPKYVPPELIHQISTFLPRADLLSMTTVNRSFQVEAERLLYWSIGHNFSSSALLSCLRTLLTVKSKAILVKSLIIAPSIAGLTPELIRRLSDCLPFLLSLTHLQLCFPTGRRGRWKPGYLVAVLKRCTFSLTSLFISDIFDLISWVPNHRALKIIGIASPLARRHARTLSCYRQLLQDSDGLTLFHLWRGERFEALNVFPLFSQQWSAKPIREALSGFFLNPKRIKFINVQTETLSDHVLIRQLVSSISSYFPHIEGMSVYIKDPDIETDPESLSSILSSLPLALFAVHCSEGSAVDFDAGRRIRLANLWCSHCPTLTWVRFPDGSGWVKEDGSWQMRSFILPLSFSPHD